MFGNGKCFHFEGDESSSSTEFILFIYFFDLITEHGSPEYEEFLSFIGDKIPLKGHAGHNGGLDKRSERRHLFESEIWIVFDDPFFLTLDDTTGTHSVYTKWRDMEVMFHVSTLLPYSTSPDDKQQVRLPLMFFSFLLTFHGS